MHGYENTPASAAAASPYQALLASPVPRPKTLVTPYVEQGTTSHKRMVWIFVALFVCIWAVAAGADASGGHSGSLLGSMVKAFFIMGPLSMLILGPVLLFWSVNKSALVRLLEHGQALHGSERSRDEFQIRGTALIRIAVSFHSFGQTKQAHFEMPAADVPPPGAELCVLERSGTSVAVLWPPTGVINARVASV